MVCQAILGSHPARRGIVEIEKLTVWVMNTWTEDSVRFEKAKGSLSNAGWSKCEVVFSKQKTQQTIGLLKAVTPANLEGTFTKLSNWNHPQMEGQKVMA